MASRHAWALGQQRGITPARQPARGQAFHGPAHQWHRPHRFQRTCARRSRHRQLVQQPPAPACISAARMGVRDKAATGSWSSSPSCSSRISAARASRYAQLQGRWQCGHCWATCPPRSSSRRRSCALTAQGTRLRQPRPVERWSGSDRFMAGEEFSHQNVYRKSGQLPPNLTQSSLQKQQLTRYKELR